MQIGIQWSIKNKLKLLMVMTAICILAGGAGGIVSFLSLKKDLNEIIESSLGEMSSSVMLEKTLYDVDNATKSLLLEYKADHQEGILLAREKFGPYSEQIMHHLASLKTYTQSGLELADEEEKAGEQDELIKIAKIEEDIGAYLSSIKTSSLNSTDLLSLEKHYDISIEPAFRRILKNIYFLEMDAKDEIKSELYEIAQKMTATIVLGVALLLWMLFLVFILSQRIIRSITTPINHLRIAISKVGTGKLNVSIPEPTNDEIGELTTAFTHMTRDLKSKVASIDDLNKEVQNRLRTEDKLMSTVQQLEGALANVKQLKGLLPICAACKKIRDDKGYWNQIEGYIEKHSDALFSHSMCPECAKAHYPDLDL